VAKARGVQLGNRANLAEAGQRGRETQVSQADQHARNVLPLSREVQATRIATLGGIARELTRHGVPTPGGAANKQAV
jgi:hypothetical protein